MIHFDERGRRIVPDDLSTLDEGEFSQLIGEVCGDLQYDLGDVLVGIAEFSKVLGSLVPALLRPDLLDHEATGGVAMQSTASEWSEQVDGPAESLREAMTLLDRLIDERNRRLGLKHCEPTSPETLMAELFGIRKSDMFDANDT